jgi:hypothetical protein
MKKIKNTILLFLLAAVPVVVFDCDLIDVFMGNLM